MGRRRFAEKKPPEPKKSSFSVIDRKGNSAPYNMADDLVGKYHSHLAEAKIAIAWRYGVKEDKDGNLPLGGVKICSELDRKLHGFDLIIWLNFAWWNQVASLEQQRAALDHFLCHCEVTKNEDGEEKTDEDGNTVYRRRNPDVEEFTEVIDRHGLYMAKLEKFAAIAMRRYEDDRPLLKKMDRNGDGNDEEELERKEKKRTRKTPVQAGA